MIFHRLRRAPKCSILQLPDCTCKYIIERMGDCKCCKEGFNCRVKAKYIMELADWDQLILMPKSTLLLLLSSVCCHNHCPIISPWFYISISGEQSLNKYFDDLLNGQNVLVNFNNVIENSFVVALFLPPCWILHQWHCWVSCV